eukprot:7383515-Prymnesium_polylepis.3
MNLRIGQHQLHGHREHEDAPRVVDLFGTGPRGEVLDVQEHVKARADLMAALLDELAHVLPERPGVREEEVEAR